LNEAQNVSMPFFGAFSNGMVRSDAAVDMDVSFSEWADIMEVKKWICSIRSLHREDRGEVWWREINRGGYQTFWRIR